MTHPFVEDLSKLSDEEVTQKISKLFKRFTMATTTGMDPFFVDQIQMLIYTYQEEEELRMMARMKKEAEESDDVGSAFNDYLDIS